MSDRHHAYTVVLEKELKDEDSEGILEAIRHLRGVMQVIPHVADHSFYTAKEQAKFELRCEMLDVIMPHWKKP